MAAPAVVVASATPAAVAETPVSSPVAATNVGISPSDADISAQRKDSDTKLSQGDASGAEAASNQVAAKEMVKVAIAQMSQGKLDDAEKELNDAATRDPKQSLVYYNMAVLRLKQGRTDDALKQFEASFLNGFAYFDEMQKDPDLDGIRNDPRFTALVKKYRTTT
ncbi:tetratricopeptide repeat protein [Paraburkholderia sp. IMGN_8]|uniref:tetratricopeptide repeat protein n=1 Tax=Paraburkholderia sp. IMGN_8 TaxID=3136564 RepID=UPI0031019124